MQYKFFTNVVYVTWTLYYKSSESFSFFFLRLKSPGLEQHVSESIFEMFIFGQTVPLSCASH